MKGKNTAKRALAWLLAICMILPVFTGVDVSAEGDRGDDTGTPGDTVAGSKLMAKQWLRYNDDGTLIMMEDDSGQPGDRDGETGEINPIPYTGYGTKDIALPGETLWIERVKYTVDCDGGNNIDEDSFNVQESTHITYSDGLTMYYCGETRGEFDIEDNETLDNANNTIKVNEKDERLVDFTPDKAGIYKLSDNDGNYLELDVDYPEIAFYDEPKHTTDNLKTDKDNSCEYNYNMDADENIIYLNLYNRYGQDGSAGISLAGGEGSGGDGNPPASFMFKYWDSEGRDKEEYGSSSGIDKYFSVEEVTGAGDTIKEGNNIWYKITFETPLIASDYYGEDAYISNIDICASAKKIYYEFNEDTEEWTPDGNADYIDTWLNARCYEYSDDERYGLLIKDWLEYDEDGNFITTDDGQPGFYDGENDGKLTPISENDYKEVAFPGEKLWIDYVTLIDGKRTHKKAEELSVTYYGDTDPYNDNTGSENADTQPEKGNANNTIKVNADNDGLVDFTPTQKGYYLFSAEGCKKTARIYVDYPEIAFYKNPEQGLSLDNLICREYESNVCDYSYYDGKTDNSIYFYLYSKDDGDWKRNITLASGNPADGGNEDNPAPFQFSFWDDKGEVLKYGDATGLDGYFSVEEVTGKNGWYKVTFDGSIKDNSDFIDSFTLRIRAKIEAVWADEDGTEHPDYDGYTDGWINAKCYSNGFYGAPLGINGELFDYYESGWTAPNPNYAVYSLKNISVDGDTVVETLINDASQIQIYLWEEDEEGNGKWPENPVDKDYVEYSNFPDNPDCIKFTFYREGTYGITDGSGSYFIIDSSLQILSFYTEPERPDDGRKIETLIDNYKALEGQQDKIYMMTFQDEYNPDSPDMDSIKINAYDENDNDVTDKFISCKKIYDGDIHIGYEVTLLDVSGDFIITATGKTTDSIIDKDGNKQPITDEQRHDLFSGIPVSYVKLTSIGITTPPSKTVYTEGEKFDASGMVVTAGYANGDKREISKEDYKVNITDVLSKNDTEVTVTYCGQTVKQKITVNAKPSNNYVSGPSYVQTPVQTNTPANTEAPASTSAPANTEAPASTSTPVNTEAPASTSAPVNTEAPASTSTPANTEAPASTSAPVKTETPASTSTPANTEAPASTSTPAKTGDSVNDSKSGTYKVTKVATDGTPVIVYTTDKAAKNASQVTIKASVKIDGKTYKVTEIAANALSGNNKLTKVTVPASIKVIGKNAFKNCSKLKKIDIPSNVTSIGSSAFKGCKSLNKITINSTKVKSIGKDSFKNISKNAVIKVPKSKKAAYKKMLKKSGYKGTVK